MEIIFVKPAAGIVVRDPATKQPLPAGGSRVVMSTYWSRRLKEGAVSVAQPEKSKTDEVKKPKGGE